MTAGKEIENYIPAKSIWPKVSASRFKAVIAIVNKHLNKRWTKVQLANHVTTKINQTNWKTLDLYARIQELAEKINGWRS